MEGRCYNCRWLLYDEDYERNRCYFDNRLILDIAGSCRKWQYYKAKRRTKDEHRKHFNDQGNDERKG